MLYCGPQLYSVIYSLIWAVLTDRWDFCWFKSVGLALVSFCVFLSLLNQGQFVCHTVSYFVFYLVVVWLSIPVQSVAWRDSSPKWPVICQVGFCTLRTHTSDFQVSRYAFWLKESLIRLCLIELRIVTPASQILLTYLLNLHLTQVIIILVPASV